MVLGSGVRGQDPSGGGVLGGVVLLGALGGAKKFKCKARGLQIDRDLQGAFNIYIKRLREIPGALPSATALER